MTMGTDIDEEYWDSLLKWTDKHFNTIFLDEDLDSLRYALYDDYEEPLNDRTDDV